MRRGNLSAFRRAWLDMFGGIEWDTAITLTYRDEPTSGKMEKTLKAFLNRVGRTVAGRSWPRRAPPPIAWLAVREVGVDGRRHWHVLIKGLEPICGRHLERACQYWRWKFGHEKCIAVSEPFRATSYLFKAVVDSDEVLWSKDVGLFLKR